MGTEWYCSIEQWTNGSGTHLSDIYSLGMMLAETIVGQRFDLPLPGCGVTFDVLSGGGAAERTMNAILRKMTALSPARRYSHMTVVATALREAAAT